MQLDPKTGEYNRKMKQDALDEIPFTEQSIEQLRGEMPEAPDLPGSTVREIAGPGGKIPLFIHTPNTVRGVYLYIHGGGWCVGNHLDSAELLIRLAKKLDIAVLSTGYRLAPENPYPAAPDDCEAAACWLVENAQDEFGTENLAIGGSSAGAHLALAVLLRLRDRHHLAPFKGVVLENGMYDLRLTPSVSERERREPNSGLSKEIIQQVVGWFAPGRDLIEPDVSPLFAELKDMPPALFLVGTDDPLLDDTLFMRARWQAVRNDSEIFICPGGTHGFAGSPTPDGRLAQAMTASFLSRVLQ